MNPLKFINRSVLPAEKLGKFLSSTYGISRLNATRICRQVGFSYSVLMQELSMSKRDYIESYFSKKLLGLDLQRHVQNKIAAKIRIGGYSGLRLSQNLPSRGQRTKTNAQTCKKKSRSEIQKKLSSKKIISKKVNKNAKGKKN